MIETLRKPVWTYYDLPFVILKHATLDMFEISVRAPCSEFGAQDHRDHTTSRQLSAEFTCHVVQVLTALVNGQNVWGTSLGVYDMRSAL